MHYLVHANQIERAFFRKWKEGFSYQTANEKENEIVAIENQKVYFQPTSSQKRHFFSRPQIRKAIGYLLNRRTCTRKNLESYSAFSSALLGLLRVILFEIAKITKTITGLIRLTLLGTRYFFSGLDRAAKVDWEAIINNHAQHILLSYYYIRHQKTWLNYVRTHGIQLLLDSGEFTRYKRALNGKSVVPIVIEEYAAFINSIKEHLIGYFNLDVTNDAAASRKNYEELYKLTGIKPIPIWHAGSKMDELERIVNEDHEILAIGGMVHLRSEKKKEQLIQEIVARFPAQNFHLLGCSSNILIKYPIFSSDSTGWLKGRKLNQLYVFEQYATRKDLTLSPLDCLIQNVKNLKNLAYRNWTTYLPE
jgi:hypothetical protein